MGKYKELRDELARAVNVANSRMDVILATRLTVGQATVLLAALDEVEKAQPSLTAMAQAHDALSKADARIAELEAALKRLREWLYPGKEKWQPTEAEPKQDFYEAVAESNREEIATLKAQLAEANTCWNGALEVQGELEAALEREEGFFNEVKALYRQRVDEAEAEKTRVLMMDAGWKETIRQLRVAEAALEKAEALLTAHTQHISKFLSDMYCTLIDPLFEGEIDVKTICELLLNAAADQRDREQKHLDKIQMLEQKPYQNINAYFAERDKERHG